MTWNVAFTGNYDEDLRALLLAYVEPGSCVLDIGASLGLWSVPLARAVGPDATVIAFEPLPANLAWLRRNLELNNLDNDVDVRAVAVGSTRAVLSIELAEPYGGVAGNAALSAQSDAAGDLVPVVALDDLVFPTRVSAIKVDAEGFEAEILRGATSLLREDRPVVLGEFNREWLHGRGEDLDALVAWLRTDLRYDVFAVDRPATSLLRREKASVQPWTPDVPGDELLLVPVERASLKT